jgi:hypothetical protein
VAAEATGATDTVTDYGRVFSSMAAASEAARCAHPDRLHRMHCVLASRSVQIDIVGDALAERMRLPLAHLLVGDDGLPPRELTIELWDQAETGMQCETGRASSEAAEVSGSAVSDDGRLVWNRLHCSVSCLDRQAQHIVGCTQDALRLSLYERGRPLHWPLTVWHSDRNVPVIHAAMVSRCGRGVLLAGAGGAGKSTAALACLSSGLDYLSDDLVGLERLKNGSFAGHSVYCSTFLDSDGLARFPALAQRAATGGNPGEEKRLVLLSEFASLRLERTAAIVAVAIVRVAGSERSSMRPASKRDVLLALAPGSLLVGRPGCARRDFEELARLVEQAPSYHLDTGSDLQGIAARVEELLSR